MSRLLIAQLPQPHHGAPQEFADCRSADPERGADLRIPQPFHPQKEAAALLLAETRNRIVKARHALAFDQIAFGCVAAYRVPGAKFRIEGLLGVQPRTNLQTEIV